MRHTMKPPSNASTVPPIPDYAPVLTRDRNKVLSALGLPLTDEYCARVYWALEAYNHHGWSQQHAVHFIQTGQLPDPQRLVPQRVVLIDHKTVKAVASTVAADLPNQWRGGWFYTNGPVAILSGQLMRYSKTRQRRFLFEAYYIC